MSVIIPHAMDGPVANSTNLVVQGRARFPHVKNPHSKGFRQGQYSTMVTVPKEDGDTAQLLSSAVELAATKLWGGARPVDWRNPLKDGDLDKSGTFNLGGYYFLEAHSKYQPPVVDLQKKPITGAEELKDGSICNFSLRFVAYELPDGCGVSCYLRAVQFLKNAPWTRGSNVLDVFETLGDNPDDAIKEFFR